MKIAYISTAEVPSTRANSLQVMKVCQALVQLGHDVRLYLPQGPEVAWEELTSTYGLSKRFPIERFPSRPFLKRYDFTLSAIAYAYNNEIDLVYTRLPWAAYLASRRGMKTVLEMHDLPTGRIGPIIYRSCLRSHAPVFTVYITAALKSLTEEKTNVKARVGQYIIAPDGVDLDRYQSLPESRQARAALGLSEIFTAVYTGGFYAGRGLEILLPLAQAFPQVQFLWVGGADEQVKHWRARLDGAGVDNVRLTGFIANEQLPLYQAAADVLLMPYSRNFGGSGGGDISRVSSPLKLFEYMASGRAILASDLPVLREVLDERTACFYEPENFEDLCRKFAWMISNVRERKQLGSAAKARARDFDWKTRMDGILKAVANFPD